MPAARATAPTPIATLEMFASVVAVSYLAVTVVEQRTWLGQSFSASLYVESARSPKKAPMPAAARPAPPTTYPTIGDRGVGAGDASAAEVAVEVEAELEATTGGLASFASTGMTTTCLSAFGPTRIVFDHAL